MSHFVRPLIPPFWTSGDVSSGFQSQSGQLAFGRGAVADPGVPRGGGANSPGGGGAPT